MRKSFSLTQPSRKEYFEPRDKKIEGVTTLRIAE
jgi:hypothetical protein